MIIRNWSKTPSVELEMLTDKAIQQLLLDGFEITLPTWVDFKNGTRSRSRCNLDQRGKQKIMVVVYFLSLEDCYWTLLHELRHAADFSMKGSTDEDEVGIYEQVKKIMEEKQ